MDFGKLPDVSGVNFFLHEDPPETVALLKKLKKETGKKKVSIYAGSPKWSITAWKGKIYPPKAKPGDFIKYYTKQFNTIELNATHYRIFPDEIIKNWTARADKNFRFCPKFPQMISHMKRLRDCEALTEEFFRSIENFGDNLGTSFLQLPPNFAPKSFGDLKNYLKFIPKPFKMSLELRHPGWFSDPAIFEETFAMLREYEIGTVITDTAGRRDVLHGQLTNSTAFIRFVGNDLHPTDYIRVDDWVEKIGRWIKSGVKTVYFFMHQPGEIHSPELTAYFIRQMNELYGYKLKEPDFYNAQAEMF